MSAQGRPLLQLLVLRDPISIYEQLQIEEALLRASKDNWCLLSFGSSEPSVVMGISAKPEEVIDEKILTEPMKRLRILRRFSGGGTVIVDEGTLFFTLILAKDAVPEHSHFPREYLEWTHQILSPAFIPHPLELIENDFVLYDKKVGGNAQCFSQERLLVHTSFLWSWRQEHMSVLRYPPKTPSYRKTRSHRDFCGKLSAHFATAEELMMKFKDALSSHFDYSVRTKTDPLITQALQTSHRRALEDLSPRWL